MSSKDRRSAKFATAMVTNTIGSDDSQASPSPRSGSASNTSKLLFWKKKKMQENRREQGDKKEGMGEIPPLPNDTPLQVPDLNLMEGIDDSLPKASVRKYDIGPHRGFSTSVYEPIHSQ